MIEEFDLQQLLKLAANPPTISTLLQAGHLDCYDENFENVTTRNAVKIKRCENKVSDALTIPLKAVLLKPPLLSTFLTVS